VQDKQKYGCHETNTVWEKIRERERERERTYRIPVLSIRAAVLTLYNGTIRKEDQNMRQCKIQYMIRKGYDSVRNSV
jgi:hypothetical protein